ARYRLPERPAAVIARHWTRTTMLTIYHSVSAIMCRIVSNLCGPRQRPTKRVWPIPGEQGPAGAGYGTVRWVEQSALALTILKTPPPTWLPRSQSKPVEYI